MTQTFVDMPDRIARLPRDSRGFPVPKFVHWMDDGTPDFRVIEPGWIADCHNHRRCWLCGGQLGRHLVFCIGPMCAVNRVNSEPPGHYDCMRFAARNCPFLTKPRMRRNEKDLPEHHVKAAGTPLGRNPGCCCLWITDSYKPFKPHHGNEGVLFRLGNPSRLEFFAEGRPATRAEVMASVNSGLPSLEDVAKFDGPDGLKELTRSVERFFKLLNETLPLESAA